MGLLLFGYLFIIPLAWVTLRYLRVPEHLELSAGGLLVFAYGFLASAIAVALV
ncbi:MAG TPA: hypothetical protein VGR24_05550 [bacterium]|jgi:hypothetical protein|nr:hypothetical protein [bacterium]